LLRRRDQGAIIPFTRIVIETSGLADPAPVLQILMTDAAIAERVVVCGVVTTVDAVNGADTLDREEISAKQAAIAIGGTVRDMSVPLTDVQGVAVGRCPRDAPDANATTGGPHVLDDDRLAERCPHFFGKDASNDICRSAGRKWNHNCDRRRRIDLCPPGARHDRKSGGARCQMQKLATWKFHGALLFSQRASHNSTR
jgi:hypothetical protein